MKTRELFSNRRNTRCAGQGSAAWLAAGLLAVIGIGWEAAVCRAQPTGPDGQQTQVLTRGPVHEAFAAVVTFNPEPGVVVTKAPPDLIEELPPEQRAEGDNVTWIPGYWAWDDERNDFLWISGTWRALPPGREWRAGYWGRTTQGYQWMSGYWADADASVTTYLPAPPASVEAGPNIAAPSLDYSWTPGCWIWYQGRYAWRAGFWAAGQPDWDWIPAYYVWTPRGYIFVDGFWDYPVERRGVLFAPVYFASRVYSRRGYSYSPTIVINLGVFTDHLFLRPSYQHYYFGDYYAANYAQGGFYAAFSFQSSRSGYDPFYSRQRWEHRQDRVWEQRVAASYQYRREHEAARPPRTWAAQRTIDPGMAESRQNRVPVATSIYQLAVRKDSPTRLQPVAREERQQLAQRGQDVQQSREQRRTLEARAENPAARRPDAVFEPAKVQLPRSPIVAKPASQRGRDQAPPRALQAPKADPRIQLAPPRSQASEAKAQRESQRSARGSEKNAQPKAQTEPETSPGEEPAANEKGAAKSARKGQDKDAKGKR